MMIRQTQQNQFRLLQLEMDRYVTLTFYQPLIWLGMLDIAERNVR